MSTQRISDLEELMSNYTWLNNFLNEILFKISKLKAIRSVSIATSFLSINQIKESHFEFLEKEINTNFDVAQHAMFLLGKLSKSINALDGEC